LAPADIHRRERVIHRREECGGQPRAAQPGEPATVTIEPENDPNGPGPEFTEACRVVGRHRYYPMVCSSEDGAIAEVIGAIDQLAADSGTGLTAADMRSRVADIWAMLAALDPELARLSAAYGQPTQDQ
jgi:hypothetical protein